MKKLLIVLSLGFCLLSLCFIEKVEAAPSIVVIDPGHGGRDAGASVGDVYESTINLAISLELKAVFEKNNYQVIMTRDTEKDLCDNEFIKRQEMNKRVNIINSSGAFCAISIHINKFSNPVYHGAQVFYSSVNFKSIDYANSVQASLKYYLKNTTREVVYRDNIYLLNKSVIPTILVECGFLSNEEERSNLLKKDYQVILANAIYYGVISTNE